MSVPLTNEELENLHNLVRFHLRTKGYPQQARDRKKGIETSIIISLDAQLVTRALDELKNRRGHKGGFARDISPWTKRLMEMKVGDELELPPMTQGALTTLRKTARKRMNIPDARWHSQTMPSGYLLITRRPDGSDHLFGKPKNPLAKRMANMMIDEKIVGKQTEIFYSTLKVQARIIMGKPEANWKRTNLANGKVRITRIR